MTPVSFGYFPPGQKFGMLAGTALCPVARACCRPTVAARPLHRLLQLRSQPFSTLTHTLMFAYLPCCAVRARRMIEGGPCVHCGASWASIWYGKREADKYCKKAVCMRQGGYLLPKKLKGA